MGVYMNEQQRKEKMSLPDSPNRWVAFGQTPHLLFFASAFSPEVIGFQSLLPDLPNWRVAWSGSKYTSGA